MTKKNIIQNSYILALGNTFSLNSEFKKADFRFHFATKTWWKLASKESLPTYEAIFSKPDISIVHSESNSEETFIKLQKLQSEAIALIREEEPALLPPVKEKSVDPIESPITGLVIEVKNWYARQFAENIGSPLAFRNMKILAVYKESPKAYLVDCEYFAGISVSCGVCGAVLTNKISQASSIGPVCASKFGLPRMNKTNAESIMKEINEKCAKIGIAKQQWIPKSQIKRMVNPDTKKVVAKFNEFSNSIIWGDFSDDNLSVSEKSNLENKE